MGQLFQSEANFSAADVTITGTNEGDVGATPFVFIPYSTARVRVKFWMQFLVGATQTSVKPILYQGADKTGTAKGDAIAIDATGAKTMILTFQFEEQVTGLIKVQYALSLTQAGGAGDGTVKQWSSWIDVFSG